MHRMGGLFVLYSYFRCTPKSFNYFCKEGRLCNRLSQASKNKRGPAKALSRLENVVLTEHQSDWNYPPEDAFQQFWGYFYSNGNFDVAIAQFARRGHFGLLVRGEISPFLMELHPLPGVQLFHVVWLPGPRTKQ